VEKAVISLREVFYLEISCSTHVLSSSRKTTAMSPLHCIRIQTFHVVWNRDCSVILGRRLCSVW